MTLFNLEFSVDKVLLKVLLTPVRCAVKSSLIGCMTILMQILI